jgi:DNA topoisomerase-6 subunit B
MLPCSIGSPSPEPKKIPMGAQIDHVWKISLKADEQKAIMYRLEISSDEAAKLPQLVVEGIESELITGAKAVNV